MVILLAACGGRPAEFKLEESQWQLLDIGGQPVDFGLQAPTARFQSDGKLQGTAGCNSYFTTYQVKNGLLTLQMIARTEMACPPANQMDLEDRFIKALGKIKGFQAHNQQLQLMNAAGEVLLTFGPIPK